ncbi:cofactor of nitrate reductase and xanthine dehydrogenase 3 isoform X2 [Tasmannia lanceolata]
MESIFGEPPFGDGPINNSPASQEPQFIPFESSKTEHGLTHVGRSDDFKSSESEPGLTHVDSSGEARMVDISGKENSKRVATASCRVILGEKAFHLVAANQIAKGDVLDVAKIAGIYGAKQTSNLIPLCHNISLTHIRVDLTLNKKDFSVEIEGEAATTGKTGVEMEAMTAVSVAGLTVYDMCKAASKDIQITDIHLEHKSGGKSGEWFRKQ